MPYLCGIDVGGTFTDCIFVDDRGKLIVSKVPSTPKDFSEGIFHAIALAADQARLSTEELLSKTDFLFHAATVATNAMVQRKGVKTGLITTRGFRDVIHIMRGKGRTSGLPIYELLHVSVSDKPVPIVPKGLIEEVSERVDCNGEIIVHLNQEEAREAIEKLIEKGVEAIAISFLWSFKNPTHEKMVERLLQEKAPHLFVTTSSEIAPKWGEYERTASAVINSYIGPLVAYYLKSIEKKAKAFGYRHQVLIMQASGGVSSISRTSRFPSLTFQSGPAAGVSGSAYQGNLMGFQNIITTDMGGTTFDVGLVYNGKPTAASISNIGQYEFFVPSIDIRSIGAGGGSVIWVDEVSKTLKVGPFSAGAEPGPICYGHGGQQPTITDADLTSGYLNSDYFLGGRMKLNKSLADQAFRELGRRVGMDMIEAASGAIKIVDYQMAELIRQVTIEKGYDPRDFVLFAFGGAGPPHAGSYAKELGVKLVVIPMGNISSVWSAYGAATSNIVHLHEVTDLLREPFDVHSVNKHLQGLLSAGREGLKEEGVQEHQMELSLSVDMRYRAQVHVVEVPFEQEQVEAGDLPRLIERFEERYESLFGKGVGYRAAGVEMVSFKCQALGKLGKPEIRKKKESERPPAKEAFKLRRPVYWDEFKDFRETQIYDGLKLTEGDRIEGPAVVEVPDTTIVVHPGQTGKIDAYGNFIIQFA